jgi:hypothetical protein
MLAALDSTKAQENMSAKLSVIVYILVCLEVGALLAILPWTSYWDENFFLDFVSGRLHAAWLAEVLQTGYVRGAVSALGLVNLLAGLRDILRFRESVGALENWEGLTANATLPSDLEKSSGSSSHLPRH